MAFESKDIYERGKMVRWRLYIDNLKIFKEIIPFVFSSK